MSFFDIFHLYDHIADKDDEGDWESNDESHIDVLRSEAAFTIVLFFGLVFKRLFLLVLQRIDLLPVMDHLCANFCNTNV